MFRGREFPCRYRFPPVDARLAGACSGWQGSQAAILATFRKSDLGIIMDKKKIEAFRKRLETRRNELREMVVRNQQDGRTADDEATQDVADRAASSYNKEFLFSQSNNDRQLLNMVDGALARMREGSFGECVSCGKEINAKRLEAVPWTRHCIECQEKAEKGLLETTP
jgi:DnaK suppressor protein